LVQNAPHIGPAQPFCGGVCHEPFQCVGESILGHRIFSPVGYRCHPETLAAARLHKPLALQVIVRPLHGNDAHPLALGQTSDRGQRFAAIEIIFARI
jgi:hypothetical protein